MMPDKKIKGDFGATKAIMRLVEMGYVVFTPMVCESLPFDLIAYKDEKTFRIQCKYNSNGKVLKNTSWSDSHGSHTREYQDTDFDYYAVYLPEIDKVVFPSVKLRGIKIRSTLPDTANHFHWWEDFVEFTDTAVKHSFKEFGYDLTSGGKERLNCRKVVRPSKEELEKLVWEKSTLQLSKDFGVSDKAFEKWCKQYSISKPPRGYWAKIAAGISVDHMRNPTKQQKPSMEELKELVTTHSLYMISSKYQVTDAIVIKWIKEFGLTKPPRNARKKQAAKAAKATKE